MYKYYSIIKLVSVMKEILDILCSCTLFKGKDKNNIEQILSEANYKIKHYKKNEIIFKADELSFYIGIVLKGRIEIQKILACGKVINFLYKNKGDIFGEEVALSRKPTYDYDIIATEESNIFLIDKQSTSDILLKDSIINSNLIVSFANSVLALNKKLELFSYYSIQKKIAFSLLYNMEINKTNYISLINSKKSWAEHLNVSRPSLSRELTHLSNKGIIKVNNKIITILKKEQLESILTS